MNYQPLNMKLQFWTVGKTHESYVKEGIEVFTRRISNYYSVQWQIIPMPKNAGMMSEMDLKLKEGEMILNFLKKEDYLVLLDERGKQMNSEGLASFIQQRANESEKNLVFLSTIASIATLLGLLGTVVGMIRAFSNLGADSGGSGAAAQLSVGISEALYNTALGIGTSAFAIIFYNIFTTKIDGITYGIDESGFTLTQTFASLYK